MTPRNAFWVVDLPRMQRLAPSFCVWRIVNLFKHALNFAFYLDNDVLEMSKRCLLASFILVSKRSLPNLNYYVHTTIIKEHKGTVR